MGKTAGVSAVKKQPIIWLLQKVRRRIPGLLLMTAAYVVNALLGVAFALGTRQVIDCATAGRPHEFLTACLRQGAIIVGVLLSLTLYRHLKDRLNADLDKDWKQHFLHILLQGDYSAVSSYHSGELINRLTNDVRIVNDGLLATFPGVAAMVTRLAAASAVLISLEPYFALVILAAGVAVVLITGFMRRKLKELHKRVSEADGRVSSFLQETMEKLLMVQAMDVSTEIERRADGLLTERYTIQRKRKNVSLAANTGVSLLSYAAGFSALVWCAFSLLHGHMTFGSLTAITQLVSQLQGPFVNLSGVIPQYLAMAAAAERLMELDDLDAEESCECQDPQGLYSEMSCLGAEHLTFSYDRDEILSNASFRLPKGAFAVITGPSGIGKSTLLKLMLGIFKPDCGELFLEQNDQRISLNRSTRRLFAYVPQGNLLLSGTLRENLLVTRPSATEDEIAQALYVSAMTEYLSQLPNGLDTVLGESGAGLSEGQAQRLAIARAILGGAPILLLDEVTSALDAETEQIVLKRIRALPNRTCIAVTHRLAALDLADWQLEAVDGTLRAKCLK